MALNVGELFATIDVKDRGTSVVRRFMTFMRDSAKKLDIDAGGLAKSAGSMGVQFTAAALKASSMAASLAAAAQGAIGLGVALAPAAGIIAALPGAVALGQAALATLKLALLGVGEAFEAALGDDPKKFEESLKGLSPAAQAAARELRSVKPAIDGLRSAVQDAFFQPLAGHIQAVADAVVGPLQSGMQGVAREFGAAAVEVARFASSSATVSAISSIFTSLRSAVAAMQPAIQPLLAGFRDIAVVGAEFSSGLAPGIAAAAQRFGEFLSNAADSGAAIGWMQGALDVFRQLGQVAGDVVGIIRSVFAAMSTGGSNALGVIGQILDQLNAFLSSAEGQRILVTIFQSLAQVGSMLMPIFKALGGALAQVAPQVASIATALGPGIAAAISALGPALAALGPGLTTVAQMLAQAFASPELQAGLLALGQGLSAALAAVAPLLPIVAQLAGILGQVLGIALQNLSAALGPVIAALASALQPALAAVSAALAQLGPLMQPIYAAFGQIAAAVVQQVLPPILQLIPSLLNGLVPAFAELARATLPVLPILTDLAVMAIQQVLPALVPILPMLTKLGVGFALFGAKVAEVVGKIKPIIEAGVAVFRWMYNTLVGNSIIPDMVNAIGRWIGTTLLGWFRDLPGKIKSAVSNLGSTVTGIGRDIVNGIWQGIQSMAGTFYNQVNSFFTNIVKNVKGALGIKSPSRVFAEIGRFMMQGMSVGVDKTAGLVVSSLRKVASLAAKTAMPDLSVPGVTVPEGFGGGRALSRAVVNVTNHYPQAEPTSVTVNRGLQYVGAMGVI
ncbi:phage tail protein [Thermocatellispora tengchongensis]|uniref:phage tail protein n=1 Tax=Thermocatellispora tengchongensis TaxID=1073253 RepID=UPI003630625B